tara:strand:- start:62 stop:757 length:696 start_codon:yes stop_codon:yes gene_type:complete
MKKNPNVVSKFLSVFKFKKDLKDVGQTFAIVINTYTQNNKRIIKTMVNNTFIYFSGKEFQTASFNFGGLKIKNNFPVTKIKKLDKVFGTYSKSKNNKYFFSEVVIANDLFQMTKYVRNKQVFKKDMLVKYIKFPTQNKILFVSLMMNSITIGFDLIHENKTKADEILEFVLNFCLEFNSDLIITLLRVLKKFNIKNKFSSLNITKNKIIQFYNSQQQKKEQLDEIVFQYKI